MFVCSQQQVHSAPAAKKHPWGQGEPWGLEIPTWGVPAATEQDIAPGTHLARWAARPWQPAGVCVCVLPWPCPEAWMAQAHISQSRERVSVAKQDKCWDQDQLGVEQKPDKCLRIAALSVRMG